MDKHPIVVNSDWLVSRHGGPDLIILDASMAAPGVAPGPDQAVQTIPGARRFDIDRQFSDLEKPFPHTVLSPEAFSQQARLLGINADSIIVVFDNSGIYSAPRAWWMFKAMGHGQVSILNGGLPAWRAAGRECDNTYAQAKTHGNFQAKPQAGWFVDITTIEQASCEGSARLIDARNADRFYGRVDEPRPGLRRGNIPNSCNLPFETLLFQDRYLPVEELRKHFQALLLDQDRPLFFSCGSGVTACIDAVAALLCGYEQVAVYDGSWCEWGQLRLR